MINQPPTAWQAIAAGKDRRVMCMMPAVSVQSRSTLMAAATSLAALNKSQQGQLLFEGRYNAAKQLHSQRHYIWLNNTPVGFVVKDNNSDNNNGDWNIYAIHTDHLNTPRLLSNQNGAEVWRWSSDAFGESAAVGSIEFNLRFPGQYYDGESGLHYNYFRDYNAQTGRYVQSDPIGLRGGLNTYLYAGGSPLIFFDLLGLNQMCLMCPSRPPVGNPNWEPYHGDSSYFHCGYQGYHEKSDPTPEDPNQECFYDENDNLVDDNHPYSNCKGTPNQYSSGTLDHIWKDTGGIRENGLDAYFESIKHKREGGGTKKCTQTARGLRCK